MKRIAAEALDEMFPNAKRGVPIKKGEFYYIKVKDGWIIETWKRGQKNENIQICAYKPITEYTIDFKVDKGDKNNEQ